MRWQSRYETEKELVGLLREYDAAYRAYSSAGDDSTIVFSLRGVTILTDANVAAAQIVYDGSEYQVCIELDNTGAKILTEATTTNIGETLEIVEVNGENRTVVLSATISGTIANGKMIIRQTNEADAKELCRKFSAGAIKIAAAAYNAKRSTASARIASSDYLPPALPEAPEFVDVSAYLKKAEAMGF